MKPMPILLAVTALLALAACSKKDDADDHAKSATITVDTDSGSDAGVKVDGDGEGGKVELKLPGGFEAKIKVPEGMTNHSKFDIDGVGLYPGAKMTKIKVNAGGSGNATVEMGFSAAADAAAVADWYQQQFEAKKVSVTRKGETLTGKTEDNDDFTLALSPGEAGKSLGLLTIVDSGKG